MKNGHARITKEVIGSRRIKLKKGNKQGGERKTNQGRVRGMVFGLYGVGSGKLLFDRKRK